MSWRDKFYQFESFSTHPARLQMRGTTLLAVGALLASASVLNPNASLLHASEFSWLPATGLVLMVVGLLECLDAAIAEEARDYFIHLPIGLLDLVIGVLVIFSINGNPDRLNLMIAAFLLNKGMLRMINAYGTQLPNKTSTLAGAWVSIVLGIVIGIIWPKCPAWFLSLCMSLDIGLRGWALINLADWLRQQFAANTAD